MALIKQFLSATGFDCANAYFVISEVNYSPRRQDIRIVVDIYKDSATKLDGKEPIESNQYTLIGTNKQIAEINDFDKFFNITAISGTGSNIIKQAYEYLKILPEFTNALSDTTVLGS